MSKILKESLLILFVIILIDSMVFNGGIKTLAGHN